MIESDFAGSDDSDLEDTSFNLPLIETGGQPGGYHTANDPQAPYQRTTITEQRGGVQIRCKSREVVHGVLNPDDDTFATLLVYDFHFDSIMNFRRISHADVTFQFSSSEPGSPPPEVVRMMHSADARFCRRPGKRAVRAKEVENSERDLVSRSCSRRRLLNP